MFLYFSTSKVGIVVGIPVGTTVSPGLLGLLVVGYFDGDAEGRELGEFVVGFTVGCPVG